MIKGTISLVYEYVEKNIIGIENMDKWENDSNGYICYPLAENEDYNEYIDIENLEIDYIADNKEKIIDNINHYKTIHNGYVDLIDKESEF